MEKAAVKIQASFRGHLSRQKLSQVNLEQTSSKTEGPSTSAQRAGPGAQAAGEEEEVDIDLDDPDVAVAAVKIQAGFKKHMMKKKK